MVTLSTNKVFDAGAPRRPVNLSLNEDLVTRARMLTTNLSGTVEALLATFVQEEQKRRRRDDAVLRDVLAAVSAFHEEHGLLSDEFSKL
ncbi:type II toxin-antitoxin system CcdA family antitoxin [Roseomonas sp. CCTCC AB2023176]|uniref:type II toxin-antitoxin system CcdA family antitoxin n=1 Tax=Roseomonas sp. CCTCC AB2023176 TaxID=3342640 RepID=UPI0035D6EA08